MAEVLGGSGRRRDPLNMAQGGSQGYEGSRRPATGRPGPTTQGGSFGMAKAGVGKAGSPGGAAGRPSSAPPARPNSGASGGFGRGNERQVFEIKARVEEMRQMKEAQFWGRLPAPKRDLPAFWSVAAHGQPFNDVRLTDGAAHHFKVLDPAPLKAGRAAPAGPATEQLANLRKSLELGKRLFANGDPSSPVRISPKDRRALESLPSLGEDDREALIAKLPVQTRLHALRNCLDRDINSKDFKPWTEAVQKELGANAWRRNREQSIRLAVQRIELMMRTHLEFLSDMECRRARAPAALTKDLLKRAFWKVDPAKTGDVSLQQFLQVWQNVLQLWEYQERPDAAGKKSSSSRALAPLRRFLLDRNAAAAIFVKYGFDKDGLLPYIVFVSALCESPARLLGHELVINTTKHGLFSDVDVAMCVGDANIKYPKCKNGVFPPSGFDPCVAFRSNMLPRAHMYLEHVYGYAGMSNLAGNVFYTANTSEASAEVVYYTGSLGIVFNKELFDMDPRRMAQNPKDPFGRKDSIQCQRFFFGHDNDIECLAIHPNRRWVATGQQLSPGGLPYVCIWEVDCCHQLQRLDHEQDDRSVIAVCFSGERDAADDSKLGGDVLVTVTSDNRHTIHLWHWMSKEDKYFKAQYIPGWFFGPEKKLPDLRANGKYYVEEVHDAVLSTINNGDDDGFSGRESMDSVVRKQRLEEIAADVRHPLIDAIRDVEVAPDDAEGFHTSHKPMTADGTWEKLDSMPGFNGTPPTLYGVVWNPFRPGDAIPGSEFCSYGVKHLKTFIMASAEGQTDGKKAGQWVASSASFGPTKIQNVLSACWVQARHAMAAPGDSCIITGFASGHIGLWVPPYPTMPGAVYTLTRVLDAHQPGPLIKLNDGTQVYGGVRVITLRADKRTLLTAGADGKVMRWQLGAPSGTFKDGSPKRGVSLTPAVEDEQGPISYLLAAPTAPLENDIPPMLRALDCHPLRPSEFIAGTDGCDIWEVDTTPRVLVEGHEDDLFCVAAHPADPYTFATACSSSRVRIWCARKHDVLMTASMGFSCMALAFSEDCFNEICVPGWRPQGGSGHHLAVSSSRGRVAVLDAVTLQPLVSIAADTTEAIDVIRYSPKDGPGLLAFGSHDMSIYIFRASKGYQRVAKCIGHSGTILHLDWSLPVESPANLRGKYLVQSSDGSCELLFWDPLTGKKVTSNQRDALMHTYSNHLGFPVMGIWPDFSDRTDINGCDRSHLGGPLVVDGLATLPGASASADDVNGAGFLLTADDFSMVRLFNYPVVWDDAPYRAYRGHSSHVTCARFLMDDRRAVSVGGHDRGIYLWRTCGINKEDRKAGDKLLLAALDEAVVRKRDAGLSKIPRPLANWGPLPMEGTGNDMSGSKLYGPLDDKLKMKESIRSQLSRTGSPGVRSSFASPFVDDSRTPSASRFIGGQQSPSRRVSTEMDQTPSLPGTRRRSTVEIEPPAQFPAVSRLVRRVSRELHSQLSITPRDPQDHQPITTASSQDWTPPQSARRPAAGPGIPESPGPSTGQSRQQSTTGAQQAGIQPGTQDTPSPGQSRQQSGTSSMPRAAAQGDPSPGQSRQQSGTSAIAQPIGTAPAAASAAQSRQQSGTSATAQPDSTAPAATSAAQSRQQSGTSATAPAPSGRHQLQDPMSTGQSRQQSGTDVYTQPSSRPQTAQSTYTPAQSRPRSPAGADPAEEVYSEEGYTPVQSRPQTPPSPPAGTVAAAGKGQPTFGSTPSTPQSTLPRGQAPGTPTGIRSLGQAERPQSSPAPAPATPSVGPSPHHSRPQSSGLGRDGMPSLASPGGSRPQSAQAARDGRAQPAHASPGQSGNYGGLFSDDEDEGPAVRQVSATVGAAAVPANRRYDEDDIDRELEDDDDANSIPDDLIEDDFEPPSR